MCVYLYIYICTYITQNTEAKAMYLLPQQTAFPLHCLIIFHIFHIFPVTNLTMMIKVSIGLL